MTAKTFALIVGLIYLAFGVLGFFPQFVTAPGGAAPGLRITALHGYLFGLFPVNFMDDLAYLAIGAWGLAAARTPGGARAYAGAMAALFASLTVLGLMPATHTLFGMMPLHGNDVWLHAGTALVALVCWLAVKGATYVQAKTAH
jgi:hypothetical protein